MLRRLAYWTANRKRAALRARVTDPAMTAFLDVPPPPLSTPLEQVEFLAIDLETTGLDPAHDDILSIGVLTVRNLAVLPGTARYWLVRPRRPMDAQTAAIHGITDTEAARGRPLADVLAELLAELAGRVLLAHNTRVETGFLSRATQALYGAPLILPVVDTMSLEQRKAARRTYAQTDGGLRLANLRDRYHLPRYRPHHALVDAQACAEVFLAQVAEDGAGGKRLSDYLC